MQIEYTRQSVKVNILAATTLRDKHVNDLNKNVVTKQSCCNHNISLKYQKNLKVATQQANQIKIIMNVNMSEPKYSIKISME